MIRTYRPPSRPFLPVPPRPAFDAEAERIDQLRRRLLAEAGDAGDAAMPALAHRRAAVLLAKLRRVSPSPLLVAGHDADAALLLDGRGLASVEPNERPGLLVLRLADDANDGRST
jgi:hypothetical protein